MLRRSTANHPLERSRPPTAPLLGAVALAMLLAGCASAPPRPPATGLVNGEQGCYAPPPDLNRAYNRPYVVLGRRYTPLRTAAGYDVVGTASWYGWESGSTTAMGTRFNPRLFTAASRVLPLPSCVQVTNLDNGRSALVLVNDRGPFVDSRIIDLSYGAAQALGVTRTGTATVRVVGLPDGALAAPGEGGMDEAAARSGADVAALPPQAQPQTQFPANVVGVVAATQEAGPSTTAAPNIAPAAAPPSRTPRRPAVAAAETSSNATGASEAAAAAWPGLATPSVANGVAATAATRPPPMIEQVLPPLSPSPAQPAAGAGPNAGATSAAVDPTLPLPAQSPVAALPAADLPAGAIAPSLPGPAQTFVQTGAFTDPARAEAERARLRAAGVGPVLIVPGVVRGQTFYRVQIGPIPGAQPDAGLLQQLRGLGITAYNLVQQ